MKIVALFRDKNKMTARKISRRIKESNTVLKVSRRRLERVFLCWSGYETMGDYIKRIFNGLDKLCFLATITGLNYFKGTCDVISVTMAMYKVHKNVH